MEKLLEGFFYQDRDRVAKKIETILKEGKEKVHVVSDFDLTLTPRRNNPSQDATTWGLLESHLPAEASVEVKKLYDKYRPLEVQGKMTAADAVDWWESALKIHQRNGIKRSDIVCDVEEKMSIRPYVKEFFDDCEERDPYNNNFSRDKRCD